METKLVSIRLPKDELETLNERAKEEKTDKTTAIKRTLAVGTKQYRLESALKKYGEGKISIGKAAQIAGVSLWEIMDEAKTKNLPSPITKEDLTEGMKNLKKVWK